MFSDPDVQQFIFGRLTWEAIPYHEPILMVTFVAVALGGIALLGAVTYFGKWGYLWNEWFTSVDHKKIGIMYGILAIVMLLSGFADAGHAQAWQLTAANAITRLSDAAVRDGRLVTNLPAQSVTLFVLPARRP